jgi:mRNA interferase MazF
MRRGDIYLASFPFGDSNVEKLRPVLLLTGPIGTGTEVLAAYISSVIPDRLLATDVVVDPNAELFHGSRLKVTSTVRLHKLATIHITSIKRWIGFIESDTMAAFIRQIVSMLNPANGKA